MNQTLYDLKIGDWFLIEDIRTDKKMKQRLLDMGMIKGSLVCCVLVSPFNDPKAYLLRGTVIALRKEDLEKIHGKKVSNENCLSW